MKYRHQKHPDHLYDVIAQGRVQAREPLTDMEEVTIYRGDDGKYWVRRKTEFEDGRFTPVAPAPSRPYSGTGD